MDVEGLHAGTRQVPYVKRYKLRAVDVYMRPLPVILYFDIKNNGSYYI
jgi:hypothetical protein